MKQFKRSLAAVSCACVLLLGVGCSYTQEYHKGDSPVWIEQQVQKGVITREQADKLLEQEKQK